MKKIYICGFFLLSVLSLSQTSYGSEPVAYYSFDGDTENADAVERTEYYLDSGIVASEGESFTYTDGKKGLCLHMDGYEALNLNVSMTSESYTVSYWINPDRITQFTPTLMITPFGFEADTFINVSLAVGDFSPNLWTHMVTPYDERISTGLPGLLTAGEWNHITIVVDENMSEDTLNKYGVTVDEYYSGAALYINGFLVSVGKAPKGLCVESTDFWFGINIWDDLYMGYVDELYIFDTPLSDSEIKELYILSGGDPDAKEPDTSQNQGQNNSFAEDNDGSFSDDFIPYEQGSVNGNNSHLNMDNVSPITTQGVESATDAYAHTAALFGFTLIILSAGLFLHYFKLKKNSYR